MADSSFFDESRDNSLVKSEIVAKYFWAWAKIMIKQIKEHNKQQEQKRTEIAYVDLFSGPGSYKDGSKSTPLLILERAIANPDMSQMLVTLFNDKDSNNTRSLQQAIDSLPDLGKLNHKPIVLNKEVGEEIIQEIQKINNVPTLFFIDPWGYKGLSLKLIGSIIQGWGCDCIFFFNYNRINPGLNNPKVKEHMNSLFGQDRVDSLRAELKRPPEQRESIIVNAICQALKDVGGSHVQDFCFKNVSGSRTSHYLIFVSKDKLGHSIMKDIMAKKSSIFTQGVPSFEYNQSQAPIQLSLFDFQPIDDLENMLLDEFAGQTLTMEQIYNQHHVGKRYISKNYKEALKKLEQQGKIIADPPASQRRKQKGEITFGEQVRVSFPPK
jgi:three-Cys-motif partner protein